jgi:anti-sigma B factor antagonist
LVPFDTEREELADGSVRVSAHGELDLATASALDEALSECDADEGACVMVDLADVPFIDAAGLRVLIEARRQRVELGGELVIARPSRQVSRLLEIAGERTGLRVAPDPDEPRRFAAR